MILSRLLRVGQWYKNLIIFISLFFSTNTLYPQQLLLGFFGFCFISSVTYIFNDWVDRDKDRLHPLKKDRPLASGQVTGKAALWIALILSVLVLLIVWRLGSFYGYVLLTYFILTNVYSLGLKNIPLLDIVMISTNFALRMMAGMISFPNPYDAPYFGLLLGTIIILLTHKRSGDIKLLGKKAVDHKPVLKYYTSQYNYLYRGIGYLIVFISFYSLWKTGLDIIKILGFHALLFGTSFIFSKNPEYTSKPQWLFRSKVWIILFGLNLFIFFVMLD